MHIRWRRCQRHLVLQTWMKHKQLYHIRFRRWRPSKEAAVGAEVVAIAADETTAAVVVVEEIPHLPGPPHNNLGVQGFTKVPSIRISPQATGQDAICITNSEEVRTSVRNQPLVPGKIFILQDNEALTSPAKRQ